jgi:hypothetical protein
MSLLKQRPYSRSICWRRYIYFKISFTFAAVVLQLWNRRQLGAIIV